MTLHNISNIAELQQQISDIQNNEIQYYNFKKQMESLSTFWIKMKKKVLKNEALKVLLHFATMYLGQAGFSALAITRTKL